MSTRSTCTEFQVGSKTRLRNLALTFGLEQDPPTAVARAVGGLVMGLRVIDFRGTRPRLAGSFARAVLSAGFPIGILWIAVSRENRSVHDVLLRTSVVYDWQPKGGHHHTPT